MEDKVFELLSKMHSEMQEGFKRIGNIEKRIDRIEESTGNIEKRIEKVEGNIEGLKEGQKEIKALISELDLKNANRYMELNEKVDELRKDLNKNLKY